MPQPNFHQPSYWPSHFQINISIAKHYNFLYREMLSSERPSIYHCISFITHINSSCINIDGRKISLSKSIDRQKIQRLLDHPINIYYVINSSAMIFFISVLYSVPFLEENKILQVPILINAALHFVKWFQNLWYFRQLNFC